MAQALVSVKKSGDAAGRSKGKKHFVVLFDWSDVKTFTKDEKGILVSDFEMAEGKKPIAVYGTAKTIKAWDTLTGETDAKGYIHHVAWETPGDSKEMAEARNVLVNRELGAIVIYCDGSEPKIAGTPCCPLSFASDEGQDDAEACKNVIELATEMPTSPLGRIPVNIIPQTGDAEIDGYLNLTASAVAGV